MSNSPLKITESFLKNPQERERERERKRERARERVTESDRN